MTNLFYKFEKLGCLFFIAETKFMKLLLLTVILICFSQASHAQNKKIDSIDHLIASVRTDTGRINLLNAKAVIYVQTNLDTAIYSALANIKKRSSFII